MLDDDAYAAAEYNDAVRKRFTKAWEGLVEGYKASFLLDSGYRIFLIPSLIRILSRRAIIDCSLA